MKRISVHLTDECILERVVPYVVSGCGIEWCPDEWVWQGEVQVWYTFRYCMHMRVYAGAPCEGCVGECPGGGNPDCHTVSQPRQAPPKQVRVHSAEFRMGVRVCSIIHTSFTCTIFHFTVTTISSWSTFYLQWYVISCCCLPFLLFIVVYPSCCLPFLFYLPLLVIVVRTTSQATRT